ncbi:unnamed protein product [Symbiodinium sp. CCMP2592]|nr:unnamed protein product [Symbiodinium sp. CCMP2592]
MTYQLHPMAATARLVAFTLVRSAWAGAVSNSTCLLQRKSNMSLSKSLVFGGSATNGVYQHWYCGSSSLDKDDGLRTDWGDLDIKYMNRDDDAFDDTRPPGFSGATVNRNIFFMAVAGIGYSVDKVELKTQCYNKNGDKFTETTSKGTNLPVGTAGVWQLPAKWLPLGGSAVYCDYRIRVTALWGERKKKWIKGANYGDDFIVVKMTGTTQDVKLDIKKSPSHVKCWDTL